MITRANRLPWTLLAFLLLGCFSSIYAEIPERRDPPEITWQEGLARIKHFRSQRLKGDYSLRFELRHMPRMDVEHKYYGVLWGSWNEQGPVTRFSIWPETRAGGLEEIHLLLQNGPDARVWIQKRGDSPYQIKDHELLAPLFDNIAYSSFDLLTSYLYWPEFKYEGPSRTKGRPAYQFLMFPPEKTAQVGSVRMFLDAYYNVLLKSEVLNKKGEKVKSLTLLNFKKVDEEYIIKTVDVRDDVTRDKTRLRIHGAALGLKFSSDFFVPENLGNRPPSVTEEQYTLVR